MLDSTVPIGNFTYKRASIKDARSKGAKSRREEGVEIPTLADEGGVKNFQNFADVPIDAP